MEMGVHHTVIFVLIIIIACNAVLYPSLFSTIFRVWFGWPAPKEEPEPSPDYYPPHMRGMNPGGRAGRAAPPSGDAAGYMSRHRQETSGHGMMATLLPVYALGIFIYFGYVIYKIFLKPKPGPSQPDPWAFAGDEEDEGPTLERQQEENLQRQLAAELRAANYDGMGGHRRHRSADQQQQFTPRGNGQSPTSSPRADASDVDLLKQRLEQTEKTMDKMMEMMNNMGVAFNRVTEQLNIDAGVPVESGGPAPEDDVTSEDGVDDASWSEGSEALEGCEVLEGDLDGPDRGPEGDLKFGGGFQDMEGDDDSGDRIEELATAEGKDGGELDSSVRRRKVATDPAESAD